MPSETGGARTDVASRVIASSPEALFRAFVDPVALMAWLPPRGMTGEVFVYEPRDGGAYRMALKYPSPEDATSAKSTADADIVEGRFLRVVPEREIVQSVAFDSDDPAFAGEMTMRWTFTPMDKGTEVKIVATDVPAGITAEDHDEGLRSTLENLALFVE